MAEEWKRVHDFPSYEVSSEGKVRKNSSKELKGSLTEDGYLCVVLMETPRKKKYYVHRLVATAFINNPNNHETVDHINGIKTDNRKENLQWMTARDNIQKYHREKNHVLYEKGHRSTGRMKRGEKRRIAVVQYDKNGNLISSFVSMMEAERRTGIGSGGISACANGKKPSAGGYYWKKETVEKEPVREIGG